MKLDNNYWSTGNEVRAATTSTGNEVRTTPIDQQLNRTTNIDQRGMKLEQTIGNEVRTTPIDQQSMKLEQQLFINREWS